MEEDTEVCLDLALKHGLTEEEYQTIVTYLGRTPTYTELGMYSVMWSEHCSYKNSIAELRKLPKEGKHLLVKAGAENAGAVDIGDGLAVVFKIESHNHPSAIEPYQGAATGLGGILRDIFTMGARPEAVLNSLRFGPLDIPRVRYIFDGVVRGIGDYGNCFGVPNVGGEIYFEEAYTSNPIVNAMAVGIAKTDELLSATAKGPGNLVLIVGSKTGRDGIHGATFASEELSEESASRRPSVQIGDPFAEKLLLEATLEAGKEKLIVGIQDMGAAGLTCSSAEMAARGGCGMELYLDDVPTREEGMSPYEIMLSESQERMLLVAKPENVGALREIFAKWGLEAKVIGRVTETKLLRVYSHGRLVAEVAPDTLAVGGRTPVYHRERRKPQYIDELAAFDPLCLHEPANYNDVLKCLLASPDIASKRWVYEQYDTSVRTATVQGPGGDAAVIRVRKSKVGLALATDGNGRWCFLNPHLGAMHAVCEAALNVACCGARPRAITNCLNFGNPYDPEVFYTFSEVINGMADACRALDTPVTGGNVSFYNEGPTGAIYPTPVIGMLGVLDDVLKHIGVGFVSEGDVVAILGHNRGELGGSTFLKVIHHRVAGQLPSLSLPATKDVITFLIEAVSRGLLVSAHDVSDGGLAVSLAECCLVNGLGARITIALTDRPSRILFGESRPLVVVSFHEDAREDVIHLAEHNGVPIAVVGKVGGERLVINDAVDLSVDELKQVYETALPRYMEVVTH